LGGKYPNKIGGYAAEETPKYFCSRRENLICMNKSNYIEVLGTARDEVWQVLCPPESFESGNVLKYQRLYCKSLHKILKFIQCSQTFGLLWWK
jgi:hypothetical protein